MSHEKPPCDVAPRGAFRQKAFSGSSEARLRAARRPFAKRQEAPGGKHTAWWHNETRHTTSSKRTNMKYQSAEQQRLEAYGRGDKISISESVPQTEQALVYNS